MSVDTACMPATPDRFDSVAATQVAPLRRWRGPDRGRGRRQAPIVVDGDALVLPPDPVPDARVEEIIADEARSALLAHLAKL